MYQYRSAGSAELFELMNKEFLPQNLDVKAVMDTWITKPGFPLITVTRNYDSGRVEVKQVNEFNL